MTPVDSLKTYLLDKCIVCNKKIPKLAWYDYEAMIDGQMDYFLEGDLIHSCLIPNKDEVL